MAKAKPGDKRLGNSYWLRRTIHGKAGKFSPASLQKACVEYMEFVEANPMLEAKAFAYEGVVTIEKLPRPRIMTVKALSIFLGVDSRTWRKWKATDDKGPVCRAVEETFDEQKLGGAASGFFNATIIARLLGLADRQEVSGPNGGAIPITTTELTKEELDTELKKRGLPTRVFDDE